MSINNDELALGIADNAIAVGNALGEAAERRILIAQAKAGAVQTAVETQGVRLKAGITPAQLLKALIPPEIVATLKATPGMVSVEVSEALAPLLMKLTAAEHDQLAAQLGQLPQAKQGLIPTGGGKKSDTDPVSVKAAKPGLGSILDGAAATFRPGDTWSPRD